MPTILLFFLIISAFGVFFLLVKKVPLLVNFPEKVEPKKNFALVAGEKCDQIKRKIWGNVFLCKVLQSVFSFLRRVLFKMERFVTKWLYFLRKKSREEK